jgi:hypothetical protein
MSWKKHISHPVFMSWQCLTSSFADSEQVGWA